MNCVSLLKETYEKIKKKTKIKNLESFDIIKKVAEYRCFWKPKKVNVLLLGESHVITSDSDFKTKLNPEYFKKYPELSKYPREFVRFVYCLGYGENDILEKSIDENRGTPQFWKIFYSCYHNVSSNSCFYHILKKNKSLEDRLKEKIELLKKLKQKGIWLMDASIVGLYPKQKLGDNAQEVIQKVIEISWDSYLKHILQSIHPKHIVVIGQSVYNILQDKLNENEYDITQICQPQKRISNEEHLKNFKLYFDICKQY